MVIPEEEPRTSLSMSIGNEEGELNQLHKLINLKVKPQPHSTLSIIYSADCYCWRYIMHDSNGLMIDKGTLTEEDFKVFDNRFRIIGDIVTNEEEQQEFVLNGLTSLIQQDYEMKTRVQAMIYKLVSEGSIEAKFADRINSMMNSKNEY